jgi:3-oxoacyl-[acyl-carrier protein] reductase
MNYLIVGGSSGIGLQLVKNLLNDGHTVYAASRQKRDLPAEAKFIELDILGDVSILKTEIPDELHGLAYCPGTINLKSFGRLSEDDFLNDYKTNVLGAVKVIQQVINKLKTVNTSSIVLFSTVAANTGMGFHASVSASKSALQGLGFSLAAEFSTSKIRVNVIAPSLTDTPLASALLSNAERKEASDKRHPLGRIGNAQEIADAATFLLSDKSSWITGQVLGIDGGMSTLRTF